MLAIKVPKKEAQTLKAELFKRELFKPGYAIEKDDTSLYFPIKERFESEYEIVEKELTSLAEQPQSLKLALEGKIPSEMLEKLKTAYDTVGTIAILEIDDELKEYDSIIGETLLTTNTKLTTALAKDAGHEGVFRTQKMRYLAGEDTRKTLHKENGVTLVLDVEHVYYSSRLATERKRIMELIQPNERVLVMFSGAGPYTCVIAKNTLAQEVIGVEINPVGHALALESVKKNKLTNVTLYNGDVRDIVPGLGTFDRILMPLPKSAETFLDVALDAAKPGAHIHFYAFLHEDEYTQAHTWIHEACLAKQKREEILSSVKCGQQAPHVFRFCVDFVTQ